MKDVARNGSEQSRSEQGHDERPNRIGQKMRWGSRSFFRLRPGLYYINP